MHSFTAVVVLGALVTASLALSLCLILTFLLWWRCNMGLLHQEKSDQLIPRVCLLWSPFLSLSIVERSTLITQCTYRIELTKLSLFLNSDVWNTAWNSQLALKGISEFSPECDLWRTACPKVHFVDMDHFHHWQPQIDFRFNLNYKFSWFLTWMNFVIRGHHGRCTWSNLNLVVFLKTEFLRSVIKKDGAPVNSKFRQIAEKIKRIVVWCAISWISTEQCVCLLPACTHILSNVPTNSRDCTGEGKCIAHMPNDVTTREGTLRSYQNPIEMKEHWTLCSTWASKSMNILNSVIHPTLTYCPGIVIKKMLDIARVANRRQQWELNFNSQNIKHDESECCFKSQIECSVDL